MTDRNSGVTTKALVAITKLEAGKEYTADALATELGKFGIVPTDLTMNRTETANFWRMVITISIKRGLMIKTRKKEPSPSMEPDGYMHKRNRAVYRRTDVTTLVLPKRALDEAEKFIAEASHGQT